MTKILYFSLKIKGGGREGGTREVLRPCHPLKIWNVHLVRAMEFRNVIAVCRELHFLTSSAFYSQCAENSIF